MDLVNVLERTSGEEEWTYLLIASDAMFFDPGYYFRSMNILPVSVELFWGQIASAADVCEDLDAVSLCGCSHDQCRGWWINVADGGFL